MKSLLGLMMLTAACGASVPVPNSQLAEAQLAVGSARADGAEANPEAKVLVSLAADDLARGRRLMGIDNQRATTLCVVAATEAKLAVRLVRKAKADQEARVAGSEIRETSNP